MSVYEAIYSRLSTTGPLVALIADRIYPDVLPQNPVLPAVVSRQIDSVPEHAMGVDPGNTASRFQVSAWARTPKAAHEVIAEVVTSLRRWSPGTVNGVFIEDVFWANQVDDYDQEIRLPRSLADFIIYLR